MALFDTLLSAFKGGEEQRIPLSPGFLSGWTTAFEGKGARSYSYEAAVDDAFLSNPVAQRAVRIVAEGVGQAPIVTSDPALRALVSETSAGQSLIETLAAHSRSFAGPL